MATERDGATGHLVTRREILRAGAALVGAAGLGALSAAARAPAVAASAPTVFGSVRAAQVARPIFQVDPFWPKPLPDGWITGEVGGTAVDASDHLFTVNRRNLTEKELRVGTPSPVIIEFDPRGDVVNAWTPPIVPDGLHGCFIDHEENVWIAGNSDAIVQKYTHDGSTLLLQIGTKGLFDTSDGTLQGERLNRSRTLLNRPADVAVDPDNGDVYVADGYGNRRVVVFDRAGNYLRQWGEQATPQEAAAGVGGKFLEIVHAVVLGRDGLVYVADRKGDRIQVFDKMGAFLGNIWIAPGAGAGAGAGSVYDLDFSPESTPTANRSGSTPSPARAASSSATSAPRVTRPASSPSSTPSPSTPSPTSTPARRSAGVGSRSSSTSAPDRLRHARLTAS